MGENVNKCPAINTPSSPHPSPVKEKHPLRLNIGGHATQTQHYHVEILKAT